MWTRIKLSIIYACQWTEESDLSVSDLNGSNNVISHLGFLFLAFIHYILKNE